LKARDGLRVTPAGGSDRLATKDAYNVVHIRKTMTRTPNTVDNSGKTEISSSAMCRKSRGVVNWRHP